MAVNQECDRPAAFQNPIMEFNIGVGGDWQPNQVILQLHKAAEQLGWYLVPPSPPPPQAFMIDEPEDGVAAEENMQELVNALDNVALNQATGDRDPNEEAMESTRRV